MCAVDGRRSWADVVRVLEETLVREAERGVHYSGYWRKHLRQFDLRSCGASMGIDRGAFPDLITRPRYASRLRDRAYIALDRAVRGRPRSRRTTQRGCPSSIQIAAWSEKRAIDEGLVHHGCILELLAKFDLLGVGLACVIGDGMTNFLRPALEEFSPSTRFLSINLREGHLIDARLMATAEGVPPVEMLRSRAAVNSWLKSEGTARVGLVLAEDVDVLRGVGIDLFVNVASMQEMTPEAIHLYFDLMRSAPGSVFYCCNREEKSIKDGAVSRFAEYPWEEVEVLLDERCPWLSRYVSRRLRRIVRSLPTRHRLVRFPVEPRRVLG